MSGLNLNAFTENATRLGMRLQESFSERTRDFSITRGGAAAYFDTGEDKLKLIRKQLDSSSDREKLDAMKRLLAMISKGRNVSEFFAQVVKNVAVPNVEVRKLVYIYILRYAEFEPDLALLSINTFQRDLSDSSPLIRAMALRVLAGIRVPSIGSLVVLAIKKTASDFSPYVRKNAALAIPKCYSLDDSHLPGLIQILQILLRDRSPLTLGAVAVAFKTLCPTRLDLLHAHFRRLCRALVDADEWGQVDLLDLLVRYARTMLPRPMEGEVDKDIALLLSSAEPLLQSNNAAVVVAVVRAIYYLGLPSEHKKVIAPLIRLLDISPEVERVVLAYVFHIAQPSPYLFTPHFLRFVVHASDSTHVKTEKVRLLRMFATSENYQALLREFIDYADDDDDTLVEHAVHAIGHIARVVPEAAQQCLAALMSFIKSQHDIVVTHAVLVLKSLVQTQLALGAANGPGPALTIIERLAYRLDEMRHPQARACVLWLVGQYGTDPTRAGGGIVGEGIAAWAPDVLRRTVKTFREETSVVKLQVISLAAKLLVLSPTDKTLIALAKHAFMLARYDINYDVRDRARVVQALLIGIVPELQSTVATSWEDVESIRTHGGVVLRREQVRVVLFEGKASVVEKDDTTDPRELLGTTTLVTGRDMRGDLLPSDWLEQGIDPALRDSPEDALPPAPPVPTAIGNFAPQGRAGGKAIPVVLQPTGPEAVSPAGSVPKKATYADLDDFYASDDDAEEDEGEEEEEEEEESEDGDGEGESESEGVEEGESEGGEEGAEEEGMERHEGGSKGSNSISHSHAVR